MSDEHSILADAEIRIRLKKFAEKWKDQGYEKGQTQLFYRDFFDCFGIDVQSVAGFEHAVTKKDWRMKTQFIDLFWPGVLLVEQKSRGYDLKQARDQAAEYCIQVPYHLHPKYLLVCNFQTFHLTDIVNHQEYKFTLSELADSLEILRFMQNRANRDDLYNQAAVSIQAAELMAKLHDELNQQGYDNESMRQFLTRLTYCMFASDTGIFQTGSFYDYINNRTSIDGTDVGSKIRDLFEVLNTKATFRQKNLDDDLKKFPYVNGELFHGSIKTPAFNAYMRKLLLDISKFDWKYVSPDIFGNLFQSVMDATERRKTGSHYTTEENIMKIIKPLFLDDLNLEFNAIIKTPKTKNKKKLLEQFQNKLTNLTFFDPACGSGNFLIIAYRELRRLEHKIILEIMKQQKLIIHSKINVHQFYGIEKNEFSKRLAETSLWIMDHLMNQELSESVNFNKDFRRIPLQKHPMIYALDALETDWNKILPVHNCSYILGNPPFGGSKIITSEQRKQIKRITGSGILDYVSAWYVKAVEYINSCKCSLCRNSDDCVECQKCSFTKRDTAIGFVATSSITQGQQVSALWPIILKHAKIFFAYTAFNWDSSARSKATVFVVIIGLAKKSSKRKITFFDNCTPVQRNYISPYLLGSNTEVPIVYPAKKSLFGLPQMRMGTKPIDGGYYILSIYEKLRITHISKPSAQYIKPYVTAEEYLSYPIQEYEKVSNYKKGRWIITPQNIPLNVIDNLTHIKKRIKLVQKYRSQSKSKPTRNLHWSKFHITVIPTEPFLVIPGTTTSKRDYIPIGYLNYPYVPSNLLMVIENASLALFGLLMSKMHMTWLGGIGGKLGDGLRSTIDIYNAFPTPPSGYASLEEPAKNILAARQIHSEASLHQLYTGYMPENLLKAHKELDAATDKLYRSKPFSSDNERLIFLLQLYGKKIKHSNP